MLRRVKNPPKIVSQHQKTSIFLPLLLKGTEGDASSAENELRWLQEHVNQLSPTKNEEEKKLELWKLCKRREKLEPLQYILGTQPFGDLEIKCTKGVLIPRPETEAYTTHLAQLLNSGTFSEILKRQLATQIENSKPGTPTISPSPEVSQDQVLASTPVVEEDPEASNSITTSLPHDSQEAKSYDGNFNVSSLNILDICSGSGCISLLLHSLLSKKFSNLQIRGWDISRTACTLANENLRHNIKNGALSPKARDQVIFHQRANVFNPRSAISKQLDDVDIIISNPPYISAEKLLTETTQSVREWEPHRALVPPSEHPMNHDQHWPGQTGHVRPEDIFYARLLYLHGRRRRCRALIMEIGDQEQAIRVVEMAMSADSIATNNHIEIWRDFPDQKPQLEESTSVVIEKQTIPVVGSGSMRTVVLVLKSADGDLGKANSMPKTNDESRGVITATKTNNTKQDPIKKLIEQKLKPARQKRMV